MRPARLAAITALLLSLGIAALAADKRETRAVTGFTAIGVSAPITVHLTQGAQESVVLEGDEGALAQLETLVENGALKFRQKTRERVPLMGKVKAYVTASEIRALAIAGSGDILADALRAGDIALSISGSGDIRVASLAATRVDASIAGSGDITAAGKAESLHASVAGSGDLHAGRLEVADAKVSVAGSGDATVWARASISASVAGSGDVRYYGDPAVRKSSVMGSGSLRRAGASPS